MNKEYFFNSTTWQYLTKEEIEVQKKTQELLQKALELLSKKK